MRAPSLPPQRQAKLDAFYTDAAAKIAAAGRIHLVDWNGRDVFGFTGVPRNGVTPAITVSVGEDNFSTYTVLTWDPHGCAPDVYLVVSGAIGSFSAPR